MNAATLDDFMAFNDQLAALADAGVPLDLGLEASGDDPATTLERINADVARRVSRGESLEDAINHADRAPASYRCLLQIGVRSGGLDGALDGAQQLADTAARSRDGLRASLLYPLIVCGLAYLGLIGLCLWFSPTLAGMHQEMRLPPGTGLRTLTALRDTLPLWAPIPPTALVAWLAWRTLSNRRSASGAVDARGVFSRLTGRTAAIQQQRWATFADALATLAAGDAPLPEALRLAGCSTGDWRVGEAAKALAAALEKGPVRSDHPAASRIPPFLRWALLEAEPAVDRLRALGMAADVYRDAAERRTERTKVLAPVLACIFISGIAALLYGLALFVPVVQLLSGIAAPNPH
jgi:type II secretory pathway component PulF